MLNMNPEIVCNVIVKLHEFHAKEDVVIPDVPDNPTEDWAKHVLADHADDLSYQELKLLVNDLEPDQRHTLLALMWLGRGDYSLEEWDKAVKDAEDDSTESIDMAFIAIPFVADYLQEGLSLHEYSCSE